MAHPLRARLGKLAPTLSARERFLLVLRAHNAGEPEEPSIRGTMPRGQVREFNRYAQLAYVANTTLWPVLSVLASHVEGLDFEQRRLVRLEAAAAQLEEQYPEEEGREREPGVVTVPEFLRGMTKQLRRELREELSLRWRELRALETVWAEIAAAFDGEAITEYQVRELAAATKLKLQELWEALAPGGGLRRLPGPQPALVDQFRQVVSQSYERLGWVEPEPEPEVTGRRTQHGR